MKRKSKTNDGWVRHLPIALQQLQDQAVAEHREGDQEEQDHPASSDQKGHFPHWFITYIFLYLTILRTGSLCRTYGCCQTRQTIHCYVFGAKQWINLVQSVTEWSLIYTSVGVIYDQKTSTHMTLPSFSILFFFVTYAQDMKKEQK